ncbi:hypothetical protein AVEN_147401-1 [Araneus ventricosus]|uniref:Uncharacterized protein n=1 Tax=Araneus ventricosus TaxID=182803 RepID=A0A4Y2DNA8_ARAVE|nr:hypothetical protein AVEN_147401-1 [Araneus ventricosus]
MVAPVHILRTISFSRYLSNEFQETVNATIQRNRFFVQSENILIAMFTDERSHFRKLVLEDLVELTNWQQYEVTEPSLTRHLSEEDLRACIEESSLFLGLISDFPCHTQAVEKCVKGVTEASSKHWLGNEKRPEDWYWERANSELQPVKNLRSPASDSILYARYPASVRRGAQEIAAVGRSDCFVQCCILIVGATAIT